MEVIKSRNPMKLRALQYVEPRASVTGCPPPSNNICNVCG